MRRQGTESTLVSAFLFCVLLLTTIPAGASSWVPVSVGNISIQIPVASLTSVETSVQENDVEVTFTGLQQSSHLYYQSEILVGEQWQGQGWVCEEIPASNTGTVTKHLTTNHTSQTRIVAGVTMLATQCDTNAFVNKTGVTSNLVYSSAYQATSKPILKKRIFEFNSRLNIQEEFRILSEETVSDALFSLNELRIQLNDGKTYDEIAFRDHLRDTDHGQAMAYNTLDRRWIKFKGKLLYVAETNDGKNKTDKVTFRVINPLGQISDQGVIWISLDGRFDQNYDTYPAADNASTLLDTAVNINVLANDPNIQTWYGVEAYSSPSNGSISINQDKTITYTPNAGFYGTDTFSYRLKGNNLYEITSAPAQVTVAISQPNQPPIVTYQIPVNGDVYLTNYNIVAKAGADDSDGIISRLEFKLNNGGWFSDTTSPYSHEFGQLSEGQHTFYVRARDNEGAYSDTQAATVTVRQPNKAPTVSAQFPSNGQSFTSAEQITATASANDSDGTVSQVEFKINNGNWFTDTTSPYSHNLGRHPVGTHTLYYRAKDNNNQYSDVATVSITVTEPATLPTVNANWSPDSIKIAQSSTFSWDSTNATACILDGQVKPTTGSMSFSNLQSNKSISIYCEGDGGRSQTLTPQVTVSDWPDVAPTLSKNGNTLSWNVIADTKRYELQQANCGGNCNEIVEGT